MKAAWTGVAAATLLLTLAPMTVGGAAERAAVPGSVTVVQAVPGQEGVALGGVLVRGCAGKGAGDHVAIPRSLGHDNHDSLIGSARTTRGGVGNLWTFCGCFVTEAGLV